MFKITIYRVNWPKWDGVVPILEHMVLFCGALEKDLREGLTLLNGLENKVHAGIKTSDDPNIGWISEYIVYDIETKDKIVDYFTNRVNELTLLRDPESKLKTVVETVEL